MQEPDLPYFPEWPDDCSPDRFLLRPVPFEPARVTPAGELARMGTYSNPHARAYGTQEFELTAFAPVDAREQLDAFCDRLRVWFEAFPATDELTESLARYGEPPDAPSQRRRDAITLEIGNLRDRSEPVIVFSLIDPQTDTVGAGLNHDYWRPSDGTAYIEVQKGHAQLNGTSGGPYDAYGGQRTPQTAAGRYCSVYGFQSSTYLIPSVWQG